jgi:hypothetical protein
VGFETTIPVFERAKTVHALDQDVINTRKGVYGRAFLKRELSSYLQNTMMNENNFITKALLLHCMLSMRSGLRRSVKWWVKRIV